MAERLKQIPARLFEFWNKYTSKQKTIIISVVSAVILTIAILAFLLTKPQMVKLMDFATTQESSEVVNILTTSNIRYRLSDDGKTIYVDKREKPDALIQLGNSGIPKDGLGVEFLFDTSMSTTDRERSKRDVIYNQDYIRGILNGIDGIEDSTVYIDTKQPDYTILSENQETAISVFLVTTEAFKPDFAKGIASFVANTVGNPTTDHVRILDQKSNLLFGGKKDLSDGGAIEGELEFKERLTQSRVNQLQRLLLKAGFDDAEITPNFVFNMDIVSDLYTEYTPAEGQDQGLLSSNRVTEQNSTSGGGNAPGTDSNGDQPEYLLENDNINQSNSSSEENNYTPNKRETKTIKDRGGLIVEDSSISVALTKVRVIKEETLKDQGLLDNMTFDQYVEQNSARTTLEVPDEIYNMVSTATGIDVASMTINAWEVPVFQPTVTAQRDLSTYLMIVLAILIIALLIFVVFKGTAPVEVTELEPELSVEQLLATTKENQSLEDIEFSEKSETRRMIEKFVDENPEAVAQLLRNWLNDDWG